MRLLSTTQAATRLHVTPRRVLVLIAEGRLKARKQGRDWVIRPKALRAVRVRKPGRPRKKRWWRTTCVLFHVAQHRTVKTRKNRDAIAVVAVPCMARNAVPLALSRQTIRIRPHPCAL